MQSSEPRCAPAGIGALLLAALFCSTAKAQSPAPPAARGFEVERFLPSAPDAGWFVMDTLDMQGGLSGALSLVTSYAHNPYRVFDGSRSLAVVSDDAFVQVGLAVAYDRFRLHFTFDSPFYVKGNSGIAAGYAFMAPNVQPEKSPDGLSNARLGIDARVHGEPGDPFRLGLGTQLWFPGGEPGATRDLYATDETYGATGRALMAGDFGWFSYAGQLGLRLRLRDEAQIPGGPRGSELLFGAAAGATTPLDSNARITVGPELYGATATKSAFRSDTTALEGLLGARLEIGERRAPWLRVKIGAGGAVNQQFGTPEWRVALGIELIGHTVANP